jgi:hypothetical protein
MSPLLSAGPLALDEQVSFWLIDPDAPGSVWQRSLDYAATPPLGSWVQQLFVAALGKSEFTLRLPSALGALGATVVCYFIGRELGDETTAGLAALVIAWHPEALDEVRIGRCYGQVLLLGSVVLWMAIHWQRSPQLWRWAAGWSLASAALVWTHYTAALLPLMTGVALATGLIWNRRWNLSTLSPLIAAVLMLSLVCWPLLAPVQRLREWGRYLNFGGEASIADVVSPFWWIGLPVGLGVSWLIGRKVAFSSPRISARLLVAACAVAPPAMLLVLSGDELSSLTNPRYRVAFAPAAACLAAWLLTSTRGAIGPIAGGAALLTAAWIFAPLPPWQLGRLGAPPDRTWREINADLAEHAAAGDPIFVQSGLTEAKLVPAYLGDAGFLEYLACRVSRFYVPQQHPRIGLPMLWDDETGTTDHYRELLRRYRSADAVWVACATDTDLARNSLSGFQRLLKLEGYEVGKTRIWPEATLIRYRRPSRRL